MRNILQRAVDLGVCSALSIHYFDFLRRLAPGTADAALIAGALAVQAVLDGHSCLRLEGVAGQCLWADMAEAGDIGEECLLPGLAAWQQSIRMADFVGGPDSELTPLVLDHDRLYLRRYYEYECRLAAEVKRRVNVSGYPPAAVAPMLAPLFPDSAGETDWQKVAVAVAAMRRMCLITGGPGTGKTHTVVRIVALLRALAGTDPLRIGLAAPTGKAASRLQESLLSAGSALERYLPAQPFASLLEAQTIHRLLGPVRHSPYFRFNRDHRLPLDVLIVDEVSMVDLALMTKLIEAMPDDGRLVLLGDKDQLSSVEAGRVLADLCGDDDGYSPVCARELAAAGAGGVPVHATAGPLDDCLVRLRQSYRFSAASGIGALAAAVLSGDADETEAILAKGGDVALRANVPEEAGGVRADAEFVRRLCEGYGEFLSQTEPARALAAFRGFQVLCAHRHGPNGSLAINSWFEEVLAGREMIVRPPGSQWYPGRPVMITGNHYSLQLFNGDLGVVMDNGIGELRVFFETAAGIRSIAPARMPEHETAYALTVHKSQGSEFDCVLLVLPDRPSRLVTRELIYTAITRARKGFEVWGRQDVLLAGVAAATVRDTGLRGRLR